MTTPELSPEHQTIAEMASEKVKAYIAGFAIAKCVNYFPNEEVDEGKEEK